MSQAASLLFGPLAGPECHRASRRGWVIWVRMVPAIAAGAVAFVALWVWWMGRRIDESHVPYQELRYALTIIEGMLVACALILSPAILAGSLAGEKERGSIGLLLTTRVNAFDIVMGRLAGKLSQILMIELATVPSLLLIASMSGLGWIDTITLLALPMAVSFGGSGFALGASALSRRGRDALLFVYLVDVLFLMAPLLKGIGPAGIELLSPFEPLNALTWDELATPALLTSASWFVLGLSGLALAAWRLRPSCLGEGNGEGRRKRMRRLHRVPAMDDRRPMLWKELYIERVGTLGRAGRWIGALLVAWLGVGGLVFAALVAWDYYTGGSGGWGAWAGTIFSDGFGRSALPICLLIQWSIGLRAAVAISSERERGTWDALLTSPLEGSEIVRGKLWGSLHALRWLVGSALLAWTVSVAYGGLLAGEYAELIVEIATLGTFMAALGVRTSLRSSTATRAMGITLGLWLAAYLLGKALAFAACLAVAAACVIGWIYAIQLGLSTINGRPWFPTTWRVGFDLVFYGLFALAAALIVIETRLRFDRVAGRMTAGAAALAVERLIHGRPMAPVRIDGGRSDRGAEVVELVAAEDWTAKTPRTPRRKNLIQE